MHAEEKTCAEFTHQEVGKKKKKKRRISHAFNEKYIYLSGRLNVCTYVYVP